MSHAFKYEHFISDELQVTLFKIALQMKKANFSDSFIASAIRTAFEFEGVADLLILWDKEQDKNEKSEIIADIQELIDECSQHEKLIYPYVKFNDLDAIAKDIRSFKDSLLIIINEKSSLKELSELTGIPQPSLSRFFNTNTMPRRSTLLKIAKALNLDSIKVSSKWMR